MVEDQKTTEKLALQAVSSRVLDQAVEEVAIHRANLLYSVHKKRNISSNEEESFDEGFQPGMDPVAVQEEMPEETAIREIQKIWKKSRRLLKANDNKTDMTNVVQGLGSSVALVAEKIGTGHIQNSAIIE